MFQDSAVVYGMSPYVEAFLNEAVETTEDYVAHMALMNDAVDQFKNGRIDYECVCAAWRHDVTAEFIREPRGDRGATWDCDFEGGVWIASDGHGEFDDDWRRTISIRLNFTQTHITRVDIDNYEMIADNLQRVRIFVGDDPDNPEVEREVNQAGTDQRFRTDEFHVNTVGINIFAECSQHTDLFDLGGSIRMPEIYVEGVGFDPWAHLPNLI